MKKEQKNQQFEKIVEPSELLGLEMQDLKGGGVVVTSCTSGTVSGGAGNPTTTCKAGKVSYDLTK